MANHVYFVLQKTKEECKQLKAKIEGEKFTIYANSLMKKEESVKLVNAKEAKKVSRVNELSLKSDFCLFVNKHILFKQPIIDRLDEYLDENEILSENVQLVNFPPKFRSIPCKPLFFDLALNHLKFPQLEAETVAKSSGLTGMVKNWFWKK